MTKITPEQDTAEEFEVITAEITQTEKDIDSHDKSVLPAYCTLFVISAVLSVLGLHVMLPQDTPALPYLVVGLGAAIALVNGYFWTSLFKATKTAATRGGWATIAAQFIIIGPLVLAPSIITNYAAVTHGVSQILENEKSSVAYSSAINETSLIKAQFEEVLNLLVAQEDGFADRQKNEVDGRGTGRGGAGHVSNALLEVSGRFAKHVPIVRSGLRNYETQRAKLDTLFSEFQQVLENREDNARTLDVIRNDMNAVISAIAALNPSQYARNAANHVAGQIPIPIGAKPFQVEAIRSIQDEVSRIVSTINQMAQGFRAVKPPKKEVRSKTVIAWVNALQNLHVLILSIMVDALAPILWLLRIPALLKITAKRKALKAQRVDLKRNLAGLHGPMGTPLMEFCFDDANNLFKSWIDFRNGLYTTGMQGHKAFEMGSVGYKELSAHKRQTSLTPPNQSEIKPNFNYEKDYCETFMFENRKGGEA